MSPFTIILIKQFILGSSAMLVILILNNLLTFKKQSSNSMEGTDHE
ncbi:MAG TPA: hypothetical protein PKB05_08285 [Oligoflexia bacterium]|nr:hypothetical protein [Oligoflexia bacterium]